MRGSGAAAEVETSRVLKHCSARRVYEMALSLWEKRASQNCAPTLVSSPCGLISHVMFQRCLGCIRPVPKREGEWGFRGSPFHTRLTARSSRLWDGTAPQMPAVSLNVLLFFSASRASIAVASINNARDGNRYSRREMLTHTPAWDEPLQPR